MPYISQKERNELEFSLVRLLNTCNAMIKLGASRRKLTNYIAYNMLMVTETGGYDTMSEVLSGLRDSCTEFERDVVGPYEAKKKVENGEIKRKG